MTSSMDQETDVHLTWNHHQTTLLSVFSSLLGNENLVDCTISAEGQCFKAHRVILSACSPYFELIFTEHCETHPIVILPDIKFPILKVLMEYIYSGEVKVPQNKLNTVLDLAKTPKIKGLSSTGDIETRDNHKTKRSNESSIRCDEQGFRKSLHEQRYCAQVKQEEDISSLHNTGKKCSEDIDSLLLAAQKCDKNSHKSIYPEKAVEEPAVSQDVTDSGGFNVWQSSSLTTTLTDSNTHVSGTSLNAVFNILDSNELAGSSKETIGEQIMLSENVLLSNSTSEELRTSEYLGRNSERPDVKLLPEVKQEHPDDFTGNSIEEIILDDDTDENYDYFSGDDKSCTVGGSVIPEESISGQGFSSLEQYGYTYFEEPKPFKCEKCGRSYRYKTGLWRHLKFECGKERQFRCPQCPAKFIHNSHLKKHSRIHLRY